jgi:hypothetical protein
MFPDIADHGKGTERLTEVGKRETDGADTGQMVRQVLTEIREKWILPVESGSSEEIGTPDRRVHSILVVGKSDGNAMVCS